MGLLGTLTGVTLWNQIFPVKTKVKKSRLERENDQLQNAILQKQFETLYHDEIEEERHGVELLGINDANSALSVIDKQEGKLRARHEENLARLKRGEPAMALTWLGKRPQSAEEAQAQFDTALAAIGQMRGVELLKKSDNLAKLPPALARKAGTAPIDASGEGESTSMTFTPSLGRSQARYVLTNEDRTGE